MKQLVHEKEKAIRLRRKGLSYKEILAEVPVAKSSLSLWLKDLPLTKDEKAVLKDRKDRNISRGRIKAASEHRKQRLEREAALLIDVRRLFEEYKNEPLFHAGLAMYWAEGSKTDARWMLINTDAEVLLLMKLWLLKYTKVDESKIFYRLFIHKPYAGDGCEEWWQAKLNVAKSQFLNTIYKETKHKRKQKPSHQGCLRMEVAKSSKLLFTMKVLKNIAVEYYKKQ